MELYPHVFRMREVERLTFRDVASRLWALGFRSTLGKELSEELVFFDTQKRTGCAKQPALFEAFITGLHLQIPTDQPFLRILTTANIAIRAPIMVIPHSLKIGTGTG